MPLTDAPWCGHCKKLAPIWDELAEQYSRQSDLVIAKLDATLNDIDGITVKSFPTLVYYPKGGGEVKINYARRITCKSFVRRKSCAVTVRQVH